MTCASDHIGLVKRRAKRWTWALNVMVELKDLEQEGMKGVIRALETFDESHGARFSTYAVPWIDHYIRREVRRNARQVHVPHARCQQAYDEGAPIPVATSSTDDPGFNMGEDEHASGWVEDQDRKELVAHLLSTLPEREAMVLRMRFFDDMTLFEAGRTMGISRERARQLEVRALERIAPRLNGA